MNVVPERDPFFVLELYARLKNSELKLAEEE